MTIACPWCGRSYAMPAPSQNQHVRCPGCGRLADIPAPEDARKLKRLTAASADQDVVLVLERLAEITA